MKLVGEKTLQAPREAVWRALNDPEVLRQSIPGCESLEKIGDDAFRATVAMKIGPVQARFAGNVRLTDLDPPNGYTIVGEAAGGAAGNAKGSAKVRLEAIAGGVTRLTWDADAQISGKLAQVGARLIDSVAQSIAGHFFDRFQQVVAGETPSEVPTAMVPFWALAAGAAAIIAIVLYFLLR